MKTFLLTIIFSFNSLALANVTEEHSAYQKRALEAFKNSPEVQAKIQECVQHYSLSLQDIKIFSLHFTAENVGSGVGHEEFLVSQRIKLYADKDSYDSVSARVYVSETESITVVKLLNLANVCQ